MRRPKREIPKIDNDNIVYFGQRTEPFLASSLILRGLEDVEVLSQAMQLTHPVPWFKHIADHEKHNYDFFNVLDKRDQFAVQVRKKIETEGKEYIDNLIKDCESAGEDLVKLSESLLVEKDLEALLTNDLCEKIGVFADRASTYSAWYTIAFFEKPEMDIVDRILREHASTEQEYESWFEAATCSSRSTDTDRERKHLLDLVLLRKENIDERIREHVRSFGWLGVRYFVGSWWTEGDVKARLKLLSYEEAVQALKEDEAHKDQVDHSLRRMQEIMTSEDMQMVYQVRDIVYLRTQRADYFHHACALMQPLFREAAKRLNISYHDILYFEPSEVTEALQGKYDHQAELLERKRDMLCYSDETGYGVLSGDAAALYISERSVFDQSAELVQSFNGVTAFRGKVVGKVKIVLIPEDGESVEKGDVLVATMTTPNFIASMERAGAFITDEGGILCHAAIVSRELKKPCIIGTKIATKVLKDGMMVEVDANKGVVKILKDI